MTGDRLGLALGDGQEIEQPCARCGNYHSHYAAVTVDPDDPARLICPTCAEKVVAGWPELVAAINAVHQAVCYVGRPAEGASIASTLRALADRVEAMNTGRAVIGINTSVVVLGGQPHGVHAERWITTRERFHAADRTDGTP